MTSRKPSLTESAPSLAVTSISKLPLKSCGGVPVKRVPSKLSQPGSADPSTSLAVSASYRMGWVDLDKADGTPDMDSVLLQLGWKF